MHARAYEISAPVCGSTPWGETQTGAVSFRWAMSAGWQHTVKIVPGFGRLPSGSYRKTIVCRKLCSAKGGSGDAGVSVSTGKSAGTASRETGNRFPGSGPVNKRTPRRALCWGVRPKTDGSGGLYRACALATERGRARGRCFAKGTPPRRNQGSFAHASTSLIGSWGVGCVFAGHRA